MTSQFWSHLAVMVLVNWSSWSWSTRWWLWSGSGQCDEKCLESKKNLCLELVGLSWSSALLAAKPALWSHYPDKLCWVTPPPCFEKINQKINGNLSKAISDILQSLQIENTKDCIKISETLSEYQLRHPICQIHLPKYQILLNAVLSWDNFCC